MEFTNYITGCVADYILNDANYMRTLELLVRDSSETNSVDETIELVSKSLKDVIEYDLAESIIEASSLTKTIINSAIHMIDYRDIADKVVANVIYNIMILK